MDEWGTKTLRLIERAPGRLLVVMDQGYVIRWVSEYTLAVLGLPAERVVGRPALDFVEPEDLPQALREQRRTSNEASLDLVNAEENADGSAVIRLRTARNGVVPVRWTLMNFLDDAELGLLAIDGRVVRNGPSFDDVLPMIAEGRPTSDILDHIARQLTRLAGADDAWIVAWPDGAAHCFGPSPAAIADDAVHAACNGHEPLPSTGLVLVTGGTTAITAYPIPGPDGLSGPGAVVLRRPTSDLSLFAEEKITDAARLVAIVLSVINQRERLARSAMTDPLTGLQNRRAFEQWCEEPARPLGIVVVDLDDLKPINDTYGHAVGDAALRHVADRLRTAVRAEDRVARVGGDEFVVVCSSAVTQVAAERVAARIHRALSEPMVLGGAEIVATVSTGATATLPHEGLQLAVQRADLLLYASKREKKGRG